MMHVGWARTAVWLLHVAQNKLWNFFLFKKKKSNDYVNRCLNLGVDKVALMWAVRLVWFVGWQRALSGLGEADHCRLLRDLSRFKIVHTNRCGRQTLGHMPWVQIQRFRICPIWQSSQRPRLWDCGKNLRENWTWSRHLASSRTWKQKCVNLALLVCFCSFRFWAALFVIDRWSGHQV